MVAVVLWGQALQPGGQRAPPGGSCLRGQQCGHPRLFPHLSAGINKKTGETNARVSAFHVKYEGGPLFVGLAHEQQKDDLSADLKLTRLSASYDFGAAKLLASVGQVKDVADDVTIGVDVPLSSALTLSAGATQVRPEVGDNGTRYGLAAAYGLSKRTTAYTGFYKDSKEAGDGHLFAVGVKHTF